MEKPQPNRRLPGVLRRGCSQGDDSVSVVFPGLVTRESCSLFTCELIKHILHQRHQLPLPYEQLLVFAKRQQGSDEPVLRRPKVEDTVSRQCQQTLSNVEKLVSQLETLFSISSVPRVLLLMGGSPMNPRELYEINLEDVQLGNGEQSLRTRPCLRQIFRSLFFADPFSELRSTSLMALVVMVQAHRDCGTDWFLPKLHFKVPNRRRILTVRLSCSEQQSLPASAEDYIWFQAPVTLKGFQN
uniref:MAD2L1 binding protein n=1 Tax=Leptobrachium leishanense TaxID=445787 RepID=A0A8C5MTT6_9ANUR